MSIIIKTPQRSFKTNPEHWLGKSLYFNNLLSGKWGDKEADGSYYIETDDHVFEHILRFPRTGVLPVFYERDKGHDFALYHAILQEAKYFGIDRLESWLCERKYLDAVTVYHTLTVKTVFGDPLTHEVQLKTRRLTNTTVTPLLKKSSKFYCAEGLHDNNPRACSSSNCFKGIEGGVPVGWRSEEVLKWCIVEEVQFFDYDLCANALKDLD